ncbi:uncharacterized protein LOC132561778 [Ylistrum balloti]|uniref:uncharacterized protein LOC132561778 n=1 Tax=Ylistrum balloti TaxID=509963 RepID=UPI002905E905|nr:uncharacterized protein LOC132561778 [Ylistrum balloti]
MSSWQLVSLITVTLHVSLANTTNKVKCEYFVPGTHPSVQPDTYCSRIEFEWNCSNAIPGTTWHFLEGYIGLGRCCEPVYGWNGTFIICDRNGEADKLTPCDEGRHNYNHPFSSADTVYGYEHPDTVCEVQGALKGMDRPHVVWKQHEFISRIGNSITLIVTFNSTTEPVNVGLLHNEEQFPVQMSYDVYTASPDRKDKYVVHITISNVTTADGGQYQAVVTNKRASGWSDITHLTVKDTGKISSGSQPISGNI